jgi:hypothetical protein
MSNNSITDIIHDYADAVVCRDGERWGATWDEDGVWDLGGGFQISGRAAICDLWKTAMGGFETVIQTVLNGSYAIDEAAGTGKGRQYIQEHFEKSKGEFGILIAYYDDEYVRRGDQWLFSSRKLVPLYQGPPDLSGNFNGGESA